MLGSLLRQQRTLCGLDAEITERHGPNKVGGKNEGEGTPGCVFALQLLTGGRLDPPLFGELGLLQLDLVLCCSPRHRFAPATRPHPLGLLLLVTPMKRRETGITATTSQLKAAKAARGAAAERSNLLVRDAAPALQEVVRMKDEAHAQR